MEDNPCCLIADYLGKLFLSEEGVTDLRLFEKKPPLCIL